jgi:hypothetical protein
MGAASSTRGPSPALLLGFLEEDVEACQAGVRPEETARQGGTVELCRTRDGPVAGGIPRPLDAMWRGVCHRRHEQPSKGEGKPATAEQNDVDCGSPQVYQSLQRDRTSSARGDGASSVRAAALRTLWRRSTWAQTLDWHLPAQEVRTNAAPHGLLPLVPHRGRAECVHAQASIRSILIAQPSCRDKGEGRQCQHSAGRRVSKSLPSVHKRISVQISE